VGSSLACALNSENNNSRLSVALIETNIPNYDWPSNSFDLRVSAITRASQHFLDELGVWQNIVNERATTYHDMHVWDAGGNGSIHFDCAEIGEPNLGHIIENRIINKSLMERASHIDNVDIYCPAKPARLLLEGEHSENNIAKLHLDDGTILNTELLVGADGGQSWVRDQAGISVSTRDYQQTAVVANVTTELSHQYTAWQRFLATGPLAFLPLSNSEGADNISSIVWSTSAEEAARLCELSEADFNAELTVAFEAKLGNVLTAGPRASFPIKGQHASHYVKPHLALIGDAAHTIHPLAGQGVNLGFADAQCLAQTILSAHAAHKSIGSYKTLRRYERSRRGDNQLMLESMGIFKQLFSNNTPGIRELRNAGLNFSDKSMPLKHFFMQKALG
jgi:2-octaprenylphenol hydroxylase